MVFFFFLSMLSMKVYGSFHNERTYGWSAVILKFKEEKIQFNLESRFNADQFIRLFELHRQFEK